MSAIPHPLCQLSESEFHQARDAIVQSHGLGDSLLFKSIYLSEPKKEQLLPFLKLEHAGEVKMETARPAREAVVEYDVLHTNRIEYRRCIVGLANRDVISVEASVTEAHPYFTPQDFSFFQDACVSSPLFEEAMRDFTLPDGFKVTIDPWPYGGLEPFETSRRYMQGLVFAVDQSKGNKDSNHYGYPIPIIPVMDVLSKEVIRVDRLATGGKGDPLEAEKSQASPKKLFEHTKSAEYVPELLDQPMRTDLKPLNVVQPEGASFTVHPDGLVEWQKWRFRIGITPREGAVLHDLCYDNRSVLYRVSYSELTVPYGDPRPPYHRKQAFDFGDAGIGRGANNLELGCDCLGAIHYLDTYLAGPDGAATPAKAVVCLHEQDGGILWKHTNFRTGRAVVARNRELVVQFIVTLANYEYIFNFKLDLAGGLTIETRATGIMSVVSIDEGKFSDYGNVVTPGILAQNHQHVFAVRIDPAIDSHSGGETQVVVEESVSQKMNAKTNPHGNLYLVERQPVVKAQHLDAAPNLNRILKLENPTKQNPNSKKNVAYKLVTPATQLLLADEDSIVSKRAQYARHHMWVTGYRDGELWAAGEFTNQSREEIGGVKDMVARGDWFTEQAGSIEGEGKLSTPVIWSVFGFTHNPRVEDWPVMPMEAQQIHLRPTDFFNANPALDVPSTRNQSSVLVPCCGEPVVSTNGKAAVQEDPVAHLQGPESNPQEDGTPLASLNRTASKLEKRLSQAFGRLFQKDSGNSRGEDLSKDEEELAY